MREEDGEWGRVLRGDELGVDTVRSNELRLTGLDGEIGSFSPSPFGPCNAVDVLVAVVALVNASDTRDTCVGRKVCTSSTGGTSASTCASDSGDSSTGRGA